MFRVGPTIKNRKGPRKNFEPPRKNVSLDTARFSMFIQLLEIFEIFRNFSKKIFSQKIALSEKKIV